MRLKRDIYCTPAPAADNRHYDVSSLACAEGRGRGGERTECSEVKTAFIEQVRGRQGKIGQSTAMCRRNGLWYTVLSR